MTDEGKKTVSVAFVGGDRRSLAAAQYLTDVGYRVMTKGLPEVVGAVAWEDGADMVVLPVSGLDAAGRLPLADGAYFSCDRQWLETLPTGTLLLAGKTPRDYGLWCRALGLEYRCYLADAAYQQANAVPTAEGVVALLLSKREHTIAAAKVLVLGFGCCGRAIAQRLQALGARVAVAARGNDDRAFGQMLGLEMLTYDALPQAVERAEIICNTVPAQVLDRRALMCAAKGTVIIDVASAPGGTDFAAAAEMGLDAELAGNLPGRFFPQTAGLILAKHLENIIIEHSLASAATE